MAKLTHAARKEKAKKPQKYMANKISELTGLPCGKDEPIESRQMGENGPDVRLDNQARVMFPFTVECQNAEKWTLPSKIAQCIANKYPRTDWLVCLQCNNTKPIVVLDAEVFFNILTKVRDGASLQKAPRALLSTPDKG